jgi:chromosome segregation ATPase
VLTVLFADVGLYRFKQKFKSFVEQYNLREMHFLAHLRYKECEVQFFVARYEHFKKLAEEEASQKRSLNAEVAKFSQTESELRSQLNIYVEKFKQVEDTLNNSNDLFLTFRKEMEDMSKKTKRLEKENLNLQKKHDATNAKILEMAEDNQRAEGDVQMLRKKNATLESLVRRMQDQGRGNATLEPEHGTESEYDSNEEDYDEDDEVGSEDLEYDDETEEDVAMQTVPVGVVPYGPPPPPPVQAQEIAVNGHANGRVVKGLFKSVINGVNH